MEYSFVTHSEKGFHIEGFPDAEKLIRLDDPKSHHLAGLALHKVDLEFAADCLTAVNQAPEEPPVIRDALWRSAIVHFIKCFQPSAARSGLSDRNIYRGEPPEARVAFQFFRDLRNKHLIHEVGAYAQSTPGAVLNKRDKSYKIQKIICFIAHVDVLREDNWNNLKLLIDRAYASVVSQFDNLCDEISEELEKQSYDQLLQRDGFVYKRPSPGDLTA